MVKKKICVFISGRGTNLEALIKSSRNYSFPGNISLIVSNNAATMNDVLHILIFQKLGVVIYSLTIAFPLLMGVKHLLCDLTLYMSCFLKFLATENEQRVILQLVLKRLILLECEMTIYTKHHIFSQQLLAIDGP